MTINALFLGSTVIIAMVTVIQIPSLCSQLQASMAKATMIAPVGSTRAVIIPIAKRYYCKPCTMTLNPKLQNPGSLEPKPQDS